MCRFSRDAVVAALLDGDSTQDRIAWHVAGGFKPRHGNPEHHGRRSRMGVEAPNQQSNSSAISTQKRSFMIGPFNKQAPQEG